jgi:hypothetical protein
MNNELERIQKKEVKAYFKILFQKLAGGNEESYTRPQSGYLVSGPIHEL